MKKLTILISFLFFVKFGAIKAQHNIIKDNNVLLKIKNKDTLLNRVFLDTTYFEFGGEAIQISKLGNQSFFSFYLKQPKLFDFYGIQKLRLFITPGDTISFYLNNKQIVFEGKNAANYNFENKLKAKVPDDFYKIIRDAKSDNLDYKNILDTIYIKQISFLEEYVKNENLSSLFYSKTKDIFYFGYLGKLINPNIIPSEFFIKNPQYIENIKPIIFNRDDLLECQEFKFCLLLYLNQVTKLLNPAQDYTAEKLQKQLRFIENNLTGNVKQYAITKILVLFNEHLSPTTIAPLKKAMQMYSATFTVQNYKTILEYHLKALVNKQDAQIPDAVLNSKFINLNGKTIIFKEILALNQDKNKVLDFWASWCTPCIDVIKKSYSHRIALTKDKEVKFVYISIDEDVNKWKNRINKLKPFGMTENQYIVSEEDKKIVQEYFNCYAVPKTCLINRQNEITTFEMPMPWETENFNFWIEKASQSN